MGWFSSAPPAAAAAAIPAKSGYFSGVSLPVMPSFKTPSFLSRSPSPQVAAAPMPLAAAPMPLAAAPMPLAAAPMPLAAAPMPMASSTSSADLYAAVLDGDLDHVKSLVASGADVNVVTKGLTPLMLAIMEENLDIAIFLVGNRANVNAIKSKGGDTPLLLASQVTKDEAAVFPLISLLLKMGANVNAKNYDGETALYWACVFGNEKIANTLVFRGKADPNIATKTGETALMQAAEGGYSAIISDLIMNNVNLNMISADGETALSKAIRKRHPDVAQQLIKAGATPSDDDALRMHLPRSGGKRRLTRRRSMRKKKTRRSRR